MRAMEDANFLKQDHSHTAAFSLADLCAKLYEERLNIASPDVAARRTSEHQFEGAPMLSFHETIVPLSGTARQVLRRRLTSKFSGRRRRFDGMISYAATSTYSTWLAPGGTGKPSSRSPST